MLKCGTFKVTSKHGTNFKYLIIMECFTVRLRFKPGRSSMDTSGHYGFRVLREEMNDHEFSWVMQDPLNPRLQVPREYERIVDKETGIIKDCYLYTREDETQILIPHDFKTKKYTSRKTVYVCIQLRGTPLFKVSTVKNFFSKPEWWKRNEIDDRETFIWMLPRNGEILVNKYSRLKCRIKNEEGEIVVYNHLGKEVLRLSSECKQEEKKTNSSQDFISFEADPIGDLLWLRDNYPEKGKEIMERVLELDKGFNSRYTPVEFR